MTCASLPKGDYDGGITEGAAAIVRVLEGGDAPPASGVTGTVKRSGTSLSRPSHPPRILFGAFIFASSTLHRTSDTDAGVAVPVHFPHTFLGHVPRRRSRRQGSAPLPLPVPRRLPVAKLYLKNSDFYRKGVMSLRAKGGASIVGFTFAPPAVAFSPAAVRFLRGAESSGGGGAREAGRPGNVLRQPQKRTGRNRELLRRPSVQREDSEDR